MGAQDDAGEQAASNGREAWAGRRTGSGEHADRLTLFDGREMRVGEVWVVTVPVLDGWQMPTGQTREVVWHFTRVWHDRAIDLRYFVDGANGDAWLGFDTILRGDASSWVRRS